MSTLASTNYSPTIDTALEIAQDALTEFATNAAFAEKVAVAFGDRTNAAVLDTLRQHWATGNFEGLPAIELRPAAEINNANGAFASATNTIYVSEEFVNRNIGDKGAIANVLLEEIGHFVDSQINAIDSPGDEGAIFSNLVQDTLLSSSTLEQLSAEDDTTTLPINGQLVKIEKADPVFKISEILTGIENTLTNVQSKVNQIYDGKGLSNLNGITGGGLPFLGSDFTTKAIQNGQFVKGIYDKIKSKSIEVLGAATDANQTQIQDILFRAFKEIGLKNANGSDLTKGNIQVSVNDAGELKIDVAALGGSVSLADIALQKNLGLSQLGLQFEGDPKLGANLNYTFDFDFGFNPSASTNKFYLDTRSDKEITIGITPNLPKLSATFGLLKVDATTNSGTGLNFSLNLDGGNDNKFTTGENLSSISAGSADIKFRTYADGE